MRKRHDDPAGGLTPTMSPLAVATIAFACICGAGLLGLAMSLRDEYLAEHSRETVRFTQGIIASISALVLGLLIAGATDHYRSQGEQLRRMATEIVVLDRALAHYGPQAAAARAELRQSVRQALTEIWDHGAASGPHAPSRVLLAEITALEPADASARFIQAQALSQIVELARSRARLAHGEQAGAIQPPVVVMLVLWFAALFLANGLFGKPNALSVGATVVGSGAVAGALLLVLEFDRPFRGILRVSDEPLRLALAAIGGT